MAGIGKAAMLTGASAGIADARRIMLEDEKIQGQREDRKQAGIDRTQMRSDQQHARERQGVNENRQDKDYERQKTQQEFAKEHQEAMAMFGLTHNPKGLIDYVNKIKPGGVTIADYKQKPDGKGGWLYDLKYKNKDGSERDEKDLTVDDIGQRGVMIRPGTDFFEQNVLAGISAKSKSAAEEKAHQRELEKIRLKGELDNVSGKGSSASKSNNNTVNGQITKLVQDTSLKFDAMGKFTGTDEDGRRMVRVAQLAQTLYAGSVGTDNEQPYAVPVNEAFRIYDSVPDSKAAKKTAMEEADSMDKFKDSKGRTIKEDAWVKARTKQIIMDAERAADAEVESIVSSVKNNKSESGSGVNPQAAPVDVAAIRKDPNAMYQYAISKGANPEEAIAAIKKLHPDWMPNQAPSQAGIAR